MENFHDIERLRADEILRNRPGSTSRNVWSTARRPRRPADGPAGCGPWSGRSSGG